MVGFPSRRTLRRSFPLASARTHEKRQYFHRQPGRTRRGYPFPARARPVRRRSGPAGAVARGDGAERGGARPAAVGRYRRRVGRCGRACGFDRAGSGRPIPVIPFRRPNPTIAPYAQPVLADDVVRYVGEPVAVVLADSPEQAEDGAQAVVLDIEHLPPLADRQASVRAETLLIAGTASNCASMFTADAGDPDAAFRSAAYTRREQFRVQRMTAMTMETRGLLAEWDAAAGRLRCRGGQAAVLQPPRHGGDDEISRKRRSTILNTTSAAASARAASSIRKISWWLRGAQIRPAGEMGGGPPRALHGDCPLARDRMRSRDRARPRRHHPRTAWRYLGRYRRLCAAERHDAGAQCRAVHLRAPIASRTCA